MSISHTFNCAGLREAKLVLGWHQSKPHENFFTQFNFQVKFKARTSVIVVLKNILLES